MTTPCPLNTDAALGASWAMRERMARFTMGVAAALVAASAAAVDINGLFGIQSPTGTPVGPSVCTPQHLATLLSRLESCVPSLHRSPDDDRHSLSLLLVPLDGHSNEPLIPVAKGWRSRDLNHARLWGGEGQTVWFNVGGLGDADGGSRQLIGPADLRRAHPSLEEPSNDHRRIEVEQRLRVTSDASGNAAFVRGTEAGDRVVVQEISAPSAGAAATVLTGCVQRGGSRPCACERSS